ncbi:hypothetical protein FSW04_00380 [Baekduia soli]|uniref:Uncharacterized protein n=1 Tax=Baekduia soli TaxID=496014 RepID=A0A5B8TZM3_9ACTN|nr:hypothetical protein [Baekduia soli]QEC46173.1 hypothetical protein FSW04_00380 [Baekduia soli]
MAIFFPRPEEPFLHVTREPREGTCRACGAPDLAAYPVLGAKGWADVVKCQQCLAVDSETMMPIWGFWKPLSADWERSSAG